ncbi:alpha-D-ribose 1-methylphosphonate 5-triphosphate diphosphatase [Lutimaribacter sp. EGI FJ00015]|uniref:Alpha-D-ribose 1-methylphosphonate 5-triphosphate diphosphatase n=1 Tax=Lutimaribacter degradans TaxID=2945989 RepID=A0ACC5ZXY2_9RHOB|nr:alpha-D-ribose 1-methylphosphonate 5-triphosphate diphosphatase [Lutimaribacter sp. EGI FJ00013]MCM2562685.1 alpha-D-ribose 1-methylphosphonate 5-triphosphate diphosphatase [Lutimaribacter sp. EGI FJ00013]MCO0613842.1 alpha-D-ribose 1-methylphosphonate 5-triphosphate diphosphatase [Lutimaribacter sp. EGI FJ00015]MCO0636675.1 alpha-D-ribose 1-methylphosphonate 5-triphosphate diphosphatase [Lutimaribacter sp. EGI FJ00014]
MSAPHLTITGAQVLRPDGMSDAPVGVADGVIADRGEGAVVNMPGCTVLPGMVDIHGDGFERHLAPRRGAMTDMGVGLAAVEAELAANGITTAMLAQFWSWEGGLRSPDFALRFLEALNAYQGFGTDMRAQLRFETHMLDDYTALHETVARFGVGQVVFNDHLPHDALNKGKRPPRLTGQALKSGRNPDAHLAMMQGLHARGAEVPDAVAALAARLGAAGVILGSHDDALPETREWWRARGVTLSEFPETEEAAHAARAGDDGIVLGGPNVMRGNSHAGKVSARHLIGLGLCDALASDYFYPAPLRAAQIMAVEIGLERAWALVSDGPARLLGLPDRGRIALGLRADLVVLDRAGRVCLTMAGGRITHANGAGAAALLAARY